jgi:hypothetical protein
LFGVDLQGNETPRSALELLDIHRRVRADIISESHIGREGADKVHRRLGFNSTLIEKSDGRSGGLVLLQIIK